MSIATLGVIIGNRGFFSEKLASEGRKVILKVLKSMDIDAVIVDEKTTKLGVVETTEDAYKCGELFAANKSKIDGILISLPNFGDEIGACDSVKFANLNVPVFVHAFPDDVETMVYETRRDSFCGKLSVANVFTQYGIPFTATRNHCIDPESAEFKQEVLDFVAVCKTVNGLRKARLGQIGARPNAFRTVRFSEKILESYGITVSTIDLSSVFGLARKLTDADKKVKAKLDQITGYINTKKAPSEALLRMAKFGVVVDDWTKENHIDATSIQCWDSIQTNYGINACTLMSMMSESLMPSACEVDILGALSMYALSLASGKASALVDWNNNYKSEPDKCMLFHCGNWPVSFFGKSEMISAEVLGSSLGAENSWGAIDGRVKPGPMSFCRLVTDDNNGLIKGVIGEGSFTDDKTTKVLGSTAVIEIKNMPEFLLYMMKNGFIHHGAINPSHCASILDEAFTNYLDWPTYYHGAGCNCGCDCCG
jgi:L-fucose isomerase-like protein